MKTLHYMVSRHRKILNPFCAFWLPRYFKKTLGGEGISILVASPVDSFWTVIGRNAVRDKIVYIDRAIEYVRITIAGILQCTTLFVVAAGPRCHMRERPPRLRDKLASEGGGEARLARQQPSPQRLASALVRVYLDLGLAWSPCGYGSV